jgi:hypothetical protein
VQVNAAPGGEPLWVLLKDFAIFFPARGRVNMVLNRRLPRITARDVLSSSSSRLFIRVTGR